MYSCGQWISPCKRNQSRQSALPGRQQSSPRQGERAGHHRSLRAGHVFRGVIRELGRASRLLGSKSRNQGDRQKQHPGVWWWTLPPGEPTSAQAGRDTKNASNQGTGREPKANRPGRTKAVVATHSTAGQRVASDRTRGEPRPKGPTITPLETREGNAGHDVCAKGPFAKCVLKGQPDSSPGHSAATPWVHAPEINSSLFLFSAGPLPAENRKREEDF
jgi:hypothetical protein